VIDGQAYFTANFDAPATDAFKVRLVPVLGEAPWMVSQPASQVAFCGREATFTAAAGGTSPLAYQWFKDGTPLAGATGPALALANVKGTDAGNYTVSISNAFGHVTSAVAKLTVNAAGVSIDLYPGLTIEGVVGTTCTIQAKTNLEDPDWVTVATVTLAAPTQVWYDPQPAREIKRFYRVEGSCP
jgi:hypothetical protein